MSIPPPIFQAATCSITCRLPSSSTLRKEVCLIVERIFYDILVSISVWMTPSFKSDCTSLRAIMINQKYLCFLNREPIIRSLNIMLLSLHLVHAAIEPSSSPLYSPEDYIMCDQLAQNVDIIFYPKSSWEVLQMRHTHTMVNPRPSDSSQQNKCHVCTEDMDLIKDTLVSPHDGVHWMHTVCYFNYLYRQNT